ncbi:hypothetical protein Tco_0003912 [Tanacetum coccineum]
MANQNDSSSDNNNSDSYSTSEEIDYDSPEPPKSLLKWYHYLSDEYKDNGRFWGSKSGCNESDVKPSWKDIEKAKACMLAKAQASEASSKQPVGMKPPAFATHHLVAATVAAANCLARMSGLKKVRGRLLPAGQPPCSLWSSQRQGTTSLRQWPLVTRRVGGHEIIDISSNSSDDMRWAAKKASAPVFYGPSTQGLLDAYGCDIIKEYLEWNYFPSTENESTNMETTHKGNTDKDCIDNSNSAMSKVRVFALELVLTFPRVFWTSTCIPTDFNDGYTASFELLDLTVHYLYGFFNEVEFVVELDFYRGINEWTMDKTFL